VEALITNFCHFRIPKELHSNFESHLLQEVLQHLEVSKMDTIPLHPPLDCMVEHYIKMAEEHLWKVIASHQRD
jgi:hypothetical protein